MCVFVILAYRIIAYKCKETNKDNKELEVKTTTNVVGTVSDKESPNMRQKESSTAEIRGGSLPGNVSSSDANFLLPGNAVNEIQKSKSDGILNNPKRCGFECSLPPPLSPESLRKELLATISKDSFRKELANIMKAAENVKEEPTSIPISPEIVGRERTTFSTSLERLEKEKETMSNLAESSTKESTNSVEEESRINLKSSIYMTMKVPLDTLKDWGISLADAINSGDKENAELYAGRLAINGGAVTIAVERR